MSPRQPVTKTVDEATDDEILAQITQSAQEGTQTGISPDALTTMIYARKGCAVALELLPHLKQRLDAKDAEIARLKAELAERPTEPADNVTSLHEPMGA